MHSPGINSFTEIKTDRLILRQLVDGDVKEIFIMRSDENILKYLDMPPAKNFDDAAKFITKINNLVKNNESFYWGITLKNNPKLIGTICLWNISKENSSADVGYVLLNEFQGKGFMSEAFHEVIDFAFEKLNLNLIEAEVDPKNQPSIKLLETFNFNLKSQSDNTVIYSLKNKSYNENPGN